MVIVFMYFQLYKSQEIYKSTSVVLTSLIEEARIQIKYLQIRWDDASCDYLMAEVLTFPVKCQGC